MTNLVVGLMALMLVQSTPTSGNLQISKKFDITKLPRTTKDSHPMLTMKGSCDIAIIVFVDTGVRTFHYEPGSIDCYYSPNEHGCDVSGIFFDPIRAEYGWNDENGTFHPYTTADMARVRKRQAEIGHEGSFSFTDWEDWGFWYSPDKIRTLPYLLPPCPPNYLGEK